jgi:hypothetical protein
MTRPVRDVLAQAMAQSLGYRWSSAQQKVQWGLHADRLIRILAEHGVTLTQESK